MGIHYLSPVKQIEKNQVVKKEVYTGKKLYENEFDGLLFYELGSQQKKDELLDNIVNLSYKHSGGKMDKDELADLVPKILDDAIAEAKAKYAEFRIAGKDKVKAYTEVSESIYGLINSVKNRDVSKTRIYGVLSIIYELWGSFK